MPTDPDVTLTFSAGELELLRREMMEQAAKDLRCAADEIERLATVAPWPAGTHSSDCQNGAKMARESLDLVDKLGWPEDEAADEPSAREEA